MIVPEVYAVDGNFIPRLEKELGYPSPDQTVIPLLVDAEILPRDFIGATVIPAVLFGNDPSRSSHGHVDLIPGTAAGFQQALEEPYFNPHGALKKQADKSVRKQRGTGEFFSKSAYILAKPNQNYLFTDGFDYSDTIRVNGRTNEMLMDILAQAYSLGTVAIGSKVVIGNQFELPGPGVPAIIREVGNTILKLDYNHKTRTEILKAVTDELEHNRSPDYRGWLKKRKQT